MLAVPQQLGQTGGGECRAMREVDVHQVTRKEAELVVIQSSVLEGQRQKLYAT